MSQRGVQAVLLDAMGTLIELQPPAPLLARELTRRFDLPVGQEAAERAMGAEIAYYRAHLDEGRDQESLAGLRRRCAEVVRESLSLPTRVNPTGLTEALLASLRFELYPDVLPALNRLRQRGVRLAVVSNWDVSLGCVLAGLGVAGLLSAVITSAEVGARKPHPLIFARGLAATGVEAAGAVHVGDALEEDVAGARAAGIEPVWLRRGEQGSAPDGVRTIGSLSELQV